MGGVDPHTAPVAFWTHLLSHSRLTVPTMATRRKTKFLGLYVTPEMKKRVERAAEEEGVSISEAVRRRLNDLGNDRQDRLAAA